MTPKNQRNNRALDDGFVLSDPQLYAMIISSLPIGFSLVDRDGIILEFNYAAERLTGHSKEEVIGKSHFEIIHGSKDPGSCPLFTHVFEGHIPSIAAETVLKRKNGEAITVMVVAFPLFDTSGDFIGGAELFRDISELKRLEREHKNFLSMFAHDMKNPVVAAGGFLMRLLSGKAGPLMEKQKDYLAIIMQAITKLEHLITDFLEFSRLQGREYKPVLGPYHIEEAIYKQMDLMKIEAEKKGIRIFFEHPQENLPVAYADAAMIDRVLTNLIDNAIKYNNPGGTATIRLTGKGEDILFEVSDTGIGIHEQDIPCVFDTFCRVNRDVEGSGLGFLLPKRLWKPMAERSSWKAR